MAVELVYETHSVTVDNETGHATGWLPGQLSAYGERQARKLGERRRHDGIDVVYASDLRRAVQTAEIAFAGTGIPVHLDPRLRECDYGDCNGMPVARLKAERVRRIGTPYPGGQSYRDVVDLVAAFLADLAGDHDGQRVLVIGHSATRWALQHLLDGEDLEHLVTTPFDWRPGWEFRVPGPEAGPPAVTPVPGPGRS